jgi:uncharacterized alkaline shock family protein YloU
MPEIINTLFGRNRNDTPNSGEDVAAPTVVQTDSTQSEGADVAVTDETGDTEAIEVEPTEDVAESTEADAVESDDAGDQADDDEPVADEATIETADAEAADAESDEDATDEDLAEEDVTDEASPEVADEDGESADDVEPVAAEADDAPVAVEEADADDVDVAEPDDVDQPEPVIVVPVTAETRSDAGTRGSVTVGDGVVAKVVNIVVRKVDGVHDLADEGISVEVADDVATVRVSLVVEYGHAIKALAEQIRVDVIEAVEQFLGLDVAAVDVHVSDIHSPVTV